MLGTNNHRTFMACNIFRGWRGSTIDWNIFINICAFFDLYTKNSTPVFKLSRMPSPNLKRCRSISAGVGRDAQKIPLDQDDPTLSAFFLSEKKKNKRLKGSW